MPLLQDAEQLVRANLHEIQKGRRPWPVVIGSLTPVQLEAINSEKIARKLPPIVAEIVFVGRHIYESRVLRDGYTIDDVVQQITSSLSESAALMRSPKMTAIQNPTPRDDGYGNWVKDQAVLECSAKYPRPELYSVIPSGDRIKPKGRTEEKGHRMAALLETNSVLTDPPG